MSRTTLAERYEPEYLSEIGKRWAGRTIGENYPLESYLGGSDHSVVFLTRYGAAGAARTAALKLVFADAVDANQQLLRWQSAKELAHPNLLLILDAGRTQLDGINLLYILQEYAEENLAQILPDRALSAEETRQMLAAVVPALQFMHSRGLVHARIQPSNILASGDRIKLSSDSLSDGQPNSAMASAYDPPASSRGAASTAVDSWHLGMTLVEVLTQRVPARDRAVVPGTMPEPFRQIADRCLQADPAKRWTMAQIAVCLEGRESASDYAGPVAVPPPDELATPPASVRTATPASRAVPSEAPANDVHRNDVHRNDVHRNDVRITEAGAAVHTDAVRTDDVRTTAVPAPAVPAAVRLSEAPADAATRSAKWPYLLALAVAVIVAAFLIARFKPSAMSPATQTAQPQSSQQPASESSTQSSSTSGPASAQTGGAIPAAPAPADSDGAVVTRVMPDISSQAMHTVSGKIRLQVRVKVDEMGNVTDARMKSTKPSKYFARQALEAARQWTFSPVVEDGKPVASEWMVQFILTHRAIDDSVERLKP